MPLPSFAQIRQLYQYRCGYCGVTEDTTGGELTIDHFKPRSVGGGDELDNLVYACSKCNLYKHDFWPTPANLEKQQRLLHPLFDDLQTHVRLNMEKGVLEPLTEAGRFHIALLRLNRPQLIRHRIGLQLQNVLQEKYHLLEQQLTELQKTIAAQEQYIVALQTQLAQLRSSTE